MSEEETRDNEREYLSGSHHNGKNDWSEFFDCIEDEELPDSGRDREDDHMEQRACVVHDKDQGRHSLPRLDQSEAWNKRT